MPISCGHDDYLLAAIADMGYGGCPWCEIDSLKTALRAKRPAPPVQTGEPEGLEDAHDDEGLRSWIHQEDYDGSSSQDEEVGRRDPDLPESGN